MASSTSQEFAGCKSSGPRVCREFRVFALRGLGLRGFRFASMIPFAGLGASRHKVSFVTELGGFGSKDWCRRIGDLQEARIQGFWVIILC